MTYPPSGTTNPPTPLPGTDGSGTINGCSLPFFATANFDANPTDYAARGSQQPDDRHSRAESTPGRSSGVFSMSTMPATYMATSQPGPVQPVQQWLVGAPIAAWSRRSPIATLPSINANGVIEYPENSDKLAQRNLQVTTSGNPGFPATHRVPQTIDVRPSPPAQSADPSSILSYPDEMMIDWGKTPLGSVASIYWPGGERRVGAETGGGTLSRADAHGGRRQYDPMSGRKPGHLHSHSDRRRRQLRRLDDGRPTRHGPIRR